MESNWLNRIETGRTADIETAVGSTAVVTEVPRRRKGQITMSHRRDSSSSRSESPERLPPDQTVDHGIDTGTERSNTNNEILRYKAPKL
jgi:hypothetical protein